MIKLYLSLSTLLFVGLCQAGSPITRADWADTSSVARETHAPILVVFEAEACDYCERLKQEIIEPLSHQTDIKLPLIRNFDIYSGGKVIDFNGDSIRSRMFKNRYHVYAVPTLLILDADGKPLAEPIVGYNSRSEYLELLRASLVASFQAIE